MDLLISLRSELLKTKRTASFYLAVVAAAFIPVILMLDLVFDSTSLAERKIILNKLFTDGFVMTGFAIFPIFVMLICTLMAQTEYRNNAWKQVLTSPQTRLNVFVAKFINIHLLILFFLVASQLFMWLTAVVVHFVHPSWNVLGQSLNGYGVFVNILNSYACVLAITTIQFWMALRFKNFIVPAAVGVACWILGSIMILEYHSPYAQYFPYSFQVYPLFPKQKHLLNTVEWTSVAYSALFLILGYFDFRGRRMTA